MPSQIDNLGWNFYTLFKRGLPDGKNNGRRHWICLQCGWSNAFPNNAIYHAEKVHPSFIRDSESSRVSRSSAQVSIESFIEPRASDSSLRNVFNEQRYTDAIIGLLTRRRVAFSAVEWSELKNIALACNPAIEDRLITSRTRAMRIIEANYILYMDQLRDLLAESLSMIHLSTDLWTSPHRHGMLAVCSQWVDRNGQLKKALLGLLECSFNHSGKAQAGLIMAVIRRFNISRIGYHVGDNATSNDTCLESLAVQLKTELGLNFNSKRRRVRCIAHIINLSLQSFLLARSKEAITAALNAVTEAQDEDVLESFTNNLATISIHQEEPATRSKKRQSAVVVLHEKDLTGWQGIPALAKLHSLAVWLRSSAIHSDQWDADVGLRLGIDNVTRWNSWYKVIDNALKKKTNIIEFLLQHDDELGDTCLSGSDWDMLTKTHMFLEPFASATLYAEGSLSSVSQTLPLMDALLLHYEQAKEDHSEDIQMIKAVEMGWFVLNKYYTMSEDVPVYAAALLLDPSRRLAYIRQNWPESWHESALSAAQNIWITEYQGLPTSSEPLRTMPPPKKKRENQLSRLFEKTEVKKKAVATDLDDLSLFYNAEPIEIECTPLAWWCRSEQRAHYPRLSQMAIDILSIPAESAEPERVFSGARRTASWDRLRISCHNIERVECIGNWLKEGLIKPQWEGGLGLVCEPFSRDDVMAVDSSHLDDSEATDAK